MTKVPPRKTPLTLIPPLPSNPITRNSRILPSLTLARGFIINIQKNTLKQTSMHLTSLLITSPKAIGHFITAGAASKAENCHVVMLNRLYRRHYLLVV